MYTRLRMTLTVLRLGRHSAMECQDGDTDIAAVSQPAQGPRIASFVAGTTGEFPADPTLRNVSRVSGYTDKAAVRGTEHH